MTGYLSAPLSCSVYRTSSLSFAKICKQVRNGKCGDYRSMHINGKDSCSSGAIGIDLFNCFGKIFIVDSSYGYVRFILEYLLLHVLLKVKWFGLN